MLNVLLIGTYTPQPATEIVSMFNFLFQCHFHPKACLQPIKCAPYQEIQIKGSQLFYCKCMIILWKFVLETKR